MSPVSRGRKGRKKTSRSRSTPLSVVGADDCDCPACTGDPTNPDDLVDELLAGIGELLDSDDPIEAELLAATFVAIGAVADGFEEALLEGFIPQFEARSSAEATAMLLALGGVAPGSAGAAARAAAERLESAGVPVPRWAAEIREPVTVGDCRRLADPAGTASVLICSTHRAGRSDAFLVYVDHEDCGAADDILVTEADDLPGMIEVIAAQGRTIGFDVVTETLDGPEFRWHVETALDARAVHDDESLDDEEDTPADVDGAPYPVLATLLRARVAGLPRSARPPARHGEADPPVPAARRPSGDTGTVYQLKVGLRGSKPPIWRRLEVPADIGLGALHHVIQVAFGWDDSHLHVFETPAGNFGRADAELGHRAESSVTLAQVASAQGSRLRYTYDFGDDWEHEIVVEKVAPADAAVGYPRCTGGRRAAPPEDCGGVWGYDDLLRVLADPADPEHEERLDWLGLDDPADFDPAAFDVEAVNRALGR